MKLHIIIYRNEKLDTYKLLICYQHSKTFKVCGNPENKECIDEGYEVYDEYGNETIGIHSCCEPDVCFDDLFLYGHSLKVASPDFRNLNEFLTFIPHLENYFSLLPEESKEVYEYVKEKHFSDGKINAVKRSLNNSGYTQFKQIRIN